MGTRLKQGSLNLENVPAPLISRSSNLAQLKPSFEAPAPARYLVATEKDQSFSMKLGGLGKPGLVPVELPGPGGLRWAG